MINSALPGGNGPCWSSWGLKLRITFAVWTFAEVTTPLTAVFVVGDWILCGLIAGDVVALEGRGRIEFEGSEVELDGWLFTGIGIEGVWLEISIVLALGQEVTGPLGEGTRLEVDGLRPSSTDNGLPLICNNPGFRIRVFVSMDK